MSARPSTDFFRNYCARLSTVLAKHDWQSTADLAAALAAAWRDGRRVFICGNGGSAANAIHWANDFLYPIAKEGGRGIRILALPANPSVLTCLANDIGYDDVFSRQLATEGSNGDVLIALSGSGNSANIIRAVEQAKELGMKSFAILGYSGGKCKSLVDVPIHFEIDDMQVAEDLQLIVGHMVLQALVQARTTGRI